MFVQYIFLKRSTSVKLLVQYLAIVFLQMALPFSQQAGPGEEYEEVGAEAVREAIPCTETATDNNNNYEYEYTTSVEEEGFFLHVSLPPPPPPFLLLILLLLLPLLLPLLG